MAQGLTVGDLLSLRVWCTTASGSGQASVNTFFYKVGAASSPPATDLDVATQLDGLIHAQYKGMLSSLAQYRGCQVQILAPVPPYLATYSPAEVNGNAGAGTVTGDPMPPQTCGIISFQTGKPRQANRGRMYMPFPGQSSDSGGGSPGAVYLSELGVIAGYFDSGVAIVQAGRTATLVRVIKHGKNKDGVYPIPNTDPVTGASIGGGWATQRRRGDYGRQNKSPV